MTTPMMSQWIECKKKAKDSILLFRLGDFYEAFEEDAVLISKELDLVLTKRQQTPMSGIPVHTCEAYIDKLVAKGFRVSVAEQMEDPKVAKGIVRREIVRTITPGTVINSNLLTEKSPNYLACLAQVGKTFGLAILEVTTADFRVMELEEEEILGELSRLKPKELLVSEKWKKELPFRLSRLPDWRFDPQTTNECLAAHFKVHNLDGFGLKGKTAAIHAAGALFGYVTEDLNLSLAHVRRIRAETLSSYLSLDSATQQHLELGQLLELLDQTATPMGGRKLKEWLYHPLLSIEEITHRQDKIEKLKHQIALKKLLRDVRDLERLIMRIETGYATPRDLVALRFSLEPLPDIGSYLQELDLGSLPDLRAVAATLQKAIVETPPLRLSDGGIFKTEFDAELDELRSLKSDSQSWMVSYQSRLREETGIKTLKVGFTQAFGYYIEVSRGQSDRMPAAFQRRQTLVNTERFLSPELKEFEHKILTAEGRIAALETQLFTNLRKEIAAQADEIRAAAAVIGEIDCLLSLAEVAVKYNYARPSLETSGALSITEGRHPVIEAALSMQTFVPNDLFFDAKHKLMIITGPNMAGKSTYIRQVALIVILAQMGSYVPAKRATIGIVDKLFSRIGASDDLSRGQSTFMVEMTETANILHNATSRSLVILDEIGRGTSTYDGISIAWAVAEHLLERHVKTLFATHYWELTKLEEQNGGAVNYNVAVHESEKGIVFLRKIVRGGTDKSYGIHVAKLAGLPPSVIARAQQMLQQLHASAAEPCTSFKENQLELF